MEHGSIDAVDDQDLLGFDWTVRTYLLLSRLDLRTVGDLLAGSSAVDVLALPGSVPWVVDEICYHLVSAGVAEEAVDRWRTGPPRLDAPPMPADTGDWGLILLRGDAEAVRAAVRSCYLDCGLIEDTGAAARLAAEAPAGGGDSPLGPDHVVVEQDYRARTGYVFVRSGRYEHAAAEHNPLAGPLSAKVDTPVYALTVRKGGIGLAAYERGAVVRSLDDGAEPLSLTDFAAPPTVRAADLAWLADNVAAALVLLGTVPGGHGSVADEGLGVDPDDAEPDLAHLVAMRAP